MGWGLALVMLAASGGCSGKSKANHDAGPESVTVTVGQEGADVEGPSGVELSIPPGALDEDVEITISVPSSGFEVLPAVADSVVFAFEPHGLQFNIPVTISIPHTSLPEEIAMYTSSLGGEWTRLDAARGATELRAEVDHFSFFFNVRDVCGLYRQECCFGENAPDGACAGDSLTCIDNRCLECGFPGEPCCGTICHVVMQDGLSLTCSAQGNCEFPYPDPGIVDAGFSPDAMQGPVPDAVPAPDANPADAMPAP